MDIATSWQVSTILNKFANSEVELRRVGGVNAPVGSRRELVANSVHTADADATQRDGDNCTRCVLRFNIIGIVSSTVTKNPCNAKATSFNSRDFTPGT